MGVSIMLVNAVSSAFDADIWVVALVSASVVME